ncbi:aldehyde dehydrogenase [Verrucomicrobia bacterium SCGC AG-212-E04]|nr:aldehyde dehydrogenase [Verrucomicrobia bacterium SCGC AG-212-E04]
MNKATTNSLSSVLNGLIETCRDGQEGFQHAAENVTDITVKAIFERYSAQRAKFVTQLQVLVRSLGKDAETTSSVAGALHRGWIDLKAAVTSKDEKAILAECERGEDSAVAEYRNALDEELPGDIRSILIMQYGDVQKAHDEIKLLRDTAA